MDIASSIQSITEEIVLRLTKSIAKEHDNKNLCMSGGVALNCVVNGKILKEKIFENIWIQPAAGDAGGALGAALALWYKELKNERSSPIKDEMQGSYLGPSFNDNEIEKNLTSIGANYEKFSEDKLLEITAQELSRGKTIGWFQGKMEFGPRALGARSIIAIEKDKRSINCLSGLKDICGDKLVLINGDALKFPLDNFAPFPKSIIGNLPYNISTRLLTYWLRQIHYNHFIFIENITITIQKELADRIVSLNGNKKYGRLSVFIDLLSDTQQLLELTPSAFYPEPKVFSSVISIHPLKKPRYEVNLKTFEKITMLAFGQRRKMLRTSLKTIGGSELLKKAEIDETIRPENLSTKDFCNLSNAYDHF